MTYSVHGAPAGRDPFLDYGVKASRLVLSRVAALPPAERKRGLRAVLDRIDPALWTEVEKKGAAYAAAGHSPRAALERALAAGLANGLTTEVVRLGQGRSFGSLGETMQAQGITIDCKSVVHNHRTYYGIPMSYDTCGGTDVKVNIEKTAHPTVYRAPLRNTVPREAAARLDSTSKISGFNGTWKANSPWALFNVDPPGSDGQYNIVAIFPDATPAAKWDQARAIAFTFKRRNQTSIVSFAWSMLKDWGEGITKIPEAVEHVVGAVAGLACAAVNNPVGQVAAGAGAAYAGASPGTVAAGVGIAQGVCNGAPQLPPIQEAPPFPWVPALVLGAGGILVAWGLS